MALAGAAAGAARGARSWPAVLDAARCVDQHFELHDRVTTALQLIASSEPLPVLQRADTIRRIEGLRLTESNRLGISRRVRAVALVVVLLVVALFLLPLPHSATAGASATSDSRRVKQGAVVQVPRIIRRIDTGLTLAARHDPAMRALNLALAHLQQQLLHSPNRRAALRAISATQQQLQHMANTLHPISPAAAAQLEQALQHRLTARERSQLSGSQGKQTQTALAQALRRLASSIQHMSAAQRASLGQAMARAANSTTDATLRAALHAASSALGYNDPSSAQSALQSAASALDRSPEAAAAQRSLTSAAASLDAVKGAVSGLGGQSGQYGGAQGQAGNAGQGTGKGSGNGKGSGSGTGSGTGKGTGSGAGKGSGNGKGSGQGAGQGRVRGNGTGSGGSGGTGGHGIGGGRGGAGGHGHGQYAPGRVYIPQRQHAGPHTIITGPNGAPLSGSSVPYGAVIAQYAQTAHAALDRSTLPPTLQSYVRQYFSTISH